MNLSLRYLRATNLKPLPASSSRTSISARLLATNPSNMKADEFVFHHTEDSSYVRKLFACETLMAHMACVPPPNSSHIIDMLFTAENASMVALISLSQRPSYCPTDCQRISFTTNPRTLGFLSGTRCPEWLCVTSGSMTA